MNSKKLYRLAKLIKEIEKDFDIEYYAIVSDWANQIELRFNPKPEWKEKK